MKNLSCSEREGRPRGAVLPAALLRLATVLRPACVAGFLISSAALQAQSATGAIEGRVQNAITGSYLNNARVRILGTNREAFTNPAGEYRFDNVPAGTVSLDVFYTGLAQQQFTVAVGGGVAAQQDIGLKPSDVKVSADGTVKLAEYVVSGQKEMDAAAIAINEQRFAANRKDVVSTDAFGDINQGNIGEFVKFIPGVSLDMKDGNTPSGIMVRGFDPNYTNVTLDGGQLASTIISNTQTSSRQFVVDQATINNLARIEVTKLPTPDMSANLLGGAVNFISKSAFESPHPQLYLRAYLSANSKAVEFNKTAGPLREDSYKTLPSFDFTYIKPINKRLGFVVTFANYAQYYFNNQSVVGHRFTSAGATVANPLTTNVNTTYNPVRKDNTSGTFKVDWKPFDHHVIEFSAIENATRNQSISRVINYNVGGGIPVAFDEHNTLGSTGATGTGSAGLSNTGQLQHQLTRGLTSRWTFTASDWISELAGSYSNSTNRVRDTANGLFNTVSSTLPNVKTVNLQGYDSSKASLNKATVLDANGAVIDELKLANYNLTTVNSQPMNAQDSVKEARYNLTRSFSLWSNPVAIKVGGSVNDLVRDIKYSTLSWTYVGPDGVLNSGDEGMGGFVDNKTAGLSPGYGRPGPQWPSLFSIYDTFRDKPATFIRTDAQQGDTVKNTAVRSPWLHEKISAGYAMADVKLLHNRLRVVGGVRYELTEDEGRGYKQDGNAVFQRDASGALIKVNGAFVRKPEAGISGGAIDQGLIYQYRANFNSRDYAYYFPSIHGTFNMTENILLRAAFARTMGRPNLSDIVPNLFVGDNAAFDPNLSASFPGFITAANSTLRPWTAKNYDYSIEYYLPRNGLLSFNWYKKDIRDFFSTTTKVADVALLDSLGLSHDFVGYQYSTRVNISDAMIKGWEINLQLPLENITQGLLSKYSDWARHFSAMANVTHLELSGSRITASDWKRYVPRGRNVGLRFNFAKFNGDLFLNWKGRMLRDTSSLLPGGYEYVRARYQLDGNVAYKIDKRYSIFASARNILNAPTEWEVIGPGAPSWSALTNNQTFGAQFSLGVKGEF